jgi:hypothetical protein
MIAIRRLIESLPRKPDELGFAGQTEQQIAILYRAIGEEQDAGNWWVRAAIEAEKYNQLYQARAYLMTALERLPNHLGVRREFDRIQKRLKAAKAP